MRFDPAALRKRGGEKVYERGSAYHRRGLVRLMALGDERVLAKVEGTEDYRTIVTGAGARISGECSCPAFEDAGFCKHMVAVALAANEAKPSGALDDPLPRIREHLRGRGVDGLIDMIVELAERDAELWRRLDMASAVMSADGATIEARLTDAIDAAMTTPYFVDYRAAPDLAAGIHEVLDMVEALVPAGRAALAVKLTERMLDAFEDLLESVDDSDGECGGAMARAQQVHLEAARAVQPEPIAFARSLFERELTSSYDVFSGAGAEYADVLGSEGTAEYRRLALEAWKKLPPLQATDRAEGEYYRLEAILEGFARDDGDVEMQLALRSKDLSSSSRYVQLAQFYLDIGRRDEALRTAQDGLWVFEDRGPDQSLIRFTVRLLTEAERKDEAQAVLWKAFQRTPSRQFYIDLRELGGKEATARALAWLEGDAAGRFATTWGHPTDLLIELLTLDRMFDRAWAVVQAHGASMRYKRVLAEASEASHPREAVVVYRELVDQLALTGADYAEPAKLVLRLSTLTGALEHAAYLAALKERFKRRRNFMKLLA